MTFRRMILLPGLLWGFSIGVFPAGAGAGQNSPFSPLSNPVSGERGEIRILHRSPEGLWRLVMIPEGASPRTLESPVHFDTPVRDVRLRNDARGRTWFAAATEDGGEIVVGRPDGATPVRAVTAGSPAGWNTGPDLAFFGDERPWIAWHQRIDALEAILVREPSSGRRWRITPPDASALSRPRLLADSRGLLWIFWTGRNREGYGLFARRFDGRTWSAERRLSSTGRRPSLFPDAAEGPDGRIRVLWTAYDGSDYEIETISFDGGRWSSPRPLTQDPAADERPRIAFLEGFIPAVAWERVDEAGRRIRAATLPADGLLRPSADGIATRTGFEAIGTRGGLTIVRDVDGRLRIDRLHSTDLSMAGQAAPPAEAAPAEALPAGTLLFNPLFSESKYIAFGDSITYGEVDGLSDPSKGYVPRLDARLDAVFGPTDVFNDGLPGESTAGGLARLSYLLSLRKSRYILIMEGTNDVKVIETPIETTIFNIQEMARRSLASGSLPLLSTVIPRRDWVWYFPEYVLRHNTLNAAIRKTAADLAVPLVDMEKAFLDDPGGPESLLQADGKHPNVKGYQLLADTWYAAVRKLPFPPASIQAKSTYDKILFRRIPGQLLTWEANVKTADLGLIKGTKLYRRKAGEGPDKFRLVALVTDVFTFFDTAIESAATYEYVLSALRTDAVEGACSDVVKPVR